MEYLWIKWIHIISATVLFGTGMGSAFYVWMAHRSKNVTSIYFTMRHVVIADFLFTTPTAIIQMISGLRLTYLAGFHFTDRWILWGIILYSFAGACWLPVVWMQIKMRDIADIAFKQQKLLPEYYWKMSFYWNLLGCLAFPAIVIVFWLMVMKPTL